MKQTFLSVPRKELTAIEGVYQSTRRADSTRLKLLSLLSQRAATVDKEGVLHLEDIKDLRNHPIQWKPIGKDLWQEVDGQRRIFAIRDQAGQIVRLAYDFPGVQAQRVAWYEYRNPVLIAVAVSLLILLAVVLAPVIRVARRVFPGQRPKPAPQLGTRWLPWTTQVAAVVWVILFAALWRVAAVAGGNDSLPPTSAWDKYFVLANFVTAVALGLSFFVVFSAVRVWGYTGLRRTTMAKYSLVATACVMLSWFAMHWHLLGPVRI
jgi:hypothetical protein